MAYLLTTLSLVLSILLSALIIPRILVVAYRKKLFDIPNERKVHDEIIPRLGGISFVPTILFSLSFCDRITLPDRLRNSRKQAPFYHSRIFFFLICGLTLLYLSGIKDDLVGLRYRTKFFIQILAASMFPLAGLWINNLYGLAGIHELSPYIGIPFTMLMICLYHQRHQSD